MSGTATMPTAHSRMATRAAPASRRGVASGVAGWGVEWRVWRAVVHERSRVARRQAGGACFGSVYRKGFGGGARASLPSGGCIGARARRALQRDPRLLLAVLDDAPHLGGEALGELLRLLLVVALGVDVEERLVGVGQQLGPGRAARHRDAVDQAELGRLARPAAAAGAARPRLVSCERLAAAAAVDDDGALALDLDAAGARSPAA